VFPVRYELNLYMLASASILAPRPACQILATCIIVFLVCKF
jgi:hypothetical protein